MADQNVASDMSGRPIRRPTVSEAIASPADQPRSVPSWDMIATRHGVMYAYIAGKYYRPLRDGTGDVDWSRPISPDDFHSGNFEP